MPDRYRSNFERRFAEQLAERHVTFSYETTELEYLIPARSATYHPDFVLANGIIIETKGRLSYYDRIKMLLVKESHPELDIRFVFQRPNNKIRKGSDTTYAMWAEAHGFKWSSERIPDSWIKESEPIARKTQKKTRNRRRTYISGG